MSSFIRQEGFKIQSQPPSTDPALGGYVDPAVLLSRFDIASPQSTHTPALHPPGFSDADLDFEFSSLIPQSNYAPDHLKGQYGAGGGGTPGGGGAQNAFMASSTNAAYDAFGAYGLSQKVSASAFGGGAANGNGVGSFHDRLSNWHPSPLSSGSGDSLPSYTHPSTRAPRSPSASFVPGLGLGANRRSPSSPGATDMYGNPIPSGDSPSEYDSYCPADGTSGTSAPRPVTETMRRPSPPDRSRSTGVGKAPNSSSRSRSARRASSSGGTAYQAQLAGGAAPTAGGGSSAIMIPNHGASAIVIPSANQHSSTSARHQLAMSMPQYPTSSTGGPGSSWFASAQAMAFAHSNTPEEPMDSTGWKPSSRQTGPGLVPSSAPVLGATSKKATTKGLENVMEDPSQKQAAALLTEKRRRRRESHNAVERRRRDNINDRITELASLLPECLLEQATNGTDDIPGSPETPMSAILSPSPHLIGLPPTGPSSSLLSSSAPTSSSLMNSASAIANSSSAAKPNKGIVLAKSVEYIRYLQQLLQLHSQRNQALERMVASMRISTNGTGSSGDGTSGSDSEPSPRDQQLMTTATGTLSFADPDFNERYIQAASGAAWRNSAKMEDDLEDDTMIGS